MKVTNWTILIGFIVSGVAFFYAIVVSMVLGQVWESSAFVHVAGGFGLIVGYFCTVVGLFNAVFGIAFRISGRLPSFWKSLYPVNFGLALLAMILMSGGVAFNA